MPGLVGAEDGGAALVEGRVLLQLLLERGEALVVRALGQEEVHLQHVAVGVEGVDRHRLVVDVLEERLEARVALAAGRARVLLDGAVAVVEVLEDDRQVVARAPASWSEKRLSSAIVGLDAAQRRAPVLGQLGQRLDAGAARVGELGQLLEEGRELAGRLVEVGQRGRLRVGGLAELGHRGLELGAGRWAGGAGWRRSPSRRSAEAEAVWRVSVTKRPTSLRLSARSPITASASRVRLPSTWFCSARMASTRSVSRRAGTARRTVSWMSVARPPTPAPSSLRMIPSRSRYGRRMMLLIRSIGIVDAVCSTGIVPAGLQALLGGAGPAVDEVLADQRLRAGLAEGVGAQRAEAVLGDREVDQRALGAAVDAHAGDVAGADAGDLDVGAVDDAERVVELDRVGARLSGPASRRRPTRRRRRRRRPAGGR